MYTYLLINIFTVLGPAAFSFEKRIHYFSKWKCLFAGAAVSAVFFLAWDELFTQQGIWGFNPAYLIGITIDYLPLEEILFFFCIPFSCVFIYELVRCFQPKQISFRAGSTFLDLLIIGLLLLGIFNNQRAYTLAVCLATVGFLLIHRYSLKVNYLGYFHQAYLVCLLPFLVVNGILTRGIRAIDAGPVVWYNDAQNLGLRIFTIPVEDFIYCYLLLLMNVTFYEYFKNKWLKKS